MILPKVRDPRFTTLRRGGTLTDPHHHMLALWAAQCAEHVLPRFERDQPQDLRPRAAIEAARAWTRGELGMMQARQLAFGANAAASPLKGAARFAAYSAGQAGAVGHVAAHYLGAAAYAIKAAGVAMPPPGREEAQRKECAWQRKRIPAELRDLVLDDQRLRDKLCWGVFR
ncbi:MAG TPA: hypothetical protein VM286_04750 [Candidatus Thermoplasmatota archaeon]|nr:hypothetical protein [Candidatus Thermoplasmatota archaeon]